MKLFEKFKKTNTLRLVFFGIATVAVLALTGMNVYSLYQLRNTSIDSATEVKKSQLEEFTNQVRYRLFSPFWDLSKLDMEKIEKDLNMKIGFNDLPPEFTAVLDDALSGSLFSNIYYTNKDADGCKKSAKNVYQYNKNTKQFQPASNIPQNVCDGFGISKSRTKAIVDDYRWNTKATFDSHRSVTLTLINLAERSVIGHLNFTVNQDFLINDYLSTELKKQFGNADKTGIVVWLRDWIKDDILLSSDPSYTYDRDVYPIDIRQRFSDSLDDWTLHATILESPTVAASDASLKRNLIVLGVAVFVLFGALIFIFINAQRERELAQRQAGFLANITHELKTPLAVMQAAGENIADGRVSDGSRLKNYGDHIYNESVRLKKMIDKLLDAAKVDSGQVFTEQAPHFLHELTGEFYEANKTYLEEQGFIVNYSHEENLPLVMVDPDHIETILNNLIENSMKYSKEEKEINISVKKDGGYIAISVSDKGTGIPKKSMRYIFDKFYRVEDSLTAKTKGHGLGLSIVKNMVDKNGGVIDVQSQYGQGSTFTVKFPKLMKSDYSEDEIIRNSRKQTTHKSDQIDEYVQ